MSARPFDLTSPLMRTICVRSRESSDARNGLNGFVSFLGGLPVFLKSLSYAQTPRTGAPSTRTVGPSCSVCCESPGAAFSCAGTGLPAAACVWVNRSTGTCRPRRVCHTSTQPLPPGSTGASSWAHSPVLPGDSASRKGTSIAVSFDPGARSADAAIARPDVGFLVAVAAGTRFGVSAVQSSRCSRSYGISLSALGTTKARRVA